MIKKLSTFAAGLMLATAAYGQTTIPTTPPAAKTAPGAAVQNGAAMTSPPATVTPRATTASPVHRTDEQAKVWIGKAVYSSDGKNLGDVAELIRDPSGDVTALIANVGGFLGIGQTQVRIAPAQFSIDADRIVLRLTADQVKSMPHTEKM